MKFLLFLLVPFEILANINVNINTIEKEGIYFGFGVDFIKSGDLKITGPLNNEIDLSGGNGYGIHGEFGYKESTNVYKLMLGLSNVTFNSDYKEYALNYAIEYKKYIDRINGLYTKIDVNVDKFKIGEIKNKRYFASNLFLGYQYPLNKMVLGIEGGYQILSKLNTEEYKKTDGGKAKLNFILAW